MTAATERSRLYVSLTPGDPAPWFHQRSSSNPNYAFDTAAGRYIVLGFYATASDKPGRAAIQSVLENRHYFDDVRISFFGVSLDPRDEADGRVRESLPGIRFFWDSNGTVSRLYGAIPKDAEPSDMPVSARRFWIVLDPTLRVLSVVPFAADGSDAATLFAYLEQLPPPDRFAGIEVQAPILFLPNIFEQEFCQRLISPALFSCIGSALCISCGLNCAARSSSSSSCFLMHRAFASSLAVSMYLADVVHHTEELPLRTHLAPAAQSEAPEAMHRRYIGEHRLDNPQTP